jgi:hypothetical protein
VQGSAGQRSAAQGSAAQCSAMSIGHWTINRIAADSTVQVAVVRKMLSEKKYSVNAYTGLYPPLYTSAK